MSTLAKLHKQTADHLKSLPDVRAYGKLPRAKHAPVWSDYPPDQQEAVRRVPADFLPLYKQVQYLGGLAWHYQDPERESFFVQEDCIIPSIAYLFQQEHLHWQDGQKVRGPFWDKQLPAALQDELRHYYLFDGITGNLNNVNTLWREGPAGVELALYLGGERLHPLPFSPLSYAQTGIALGFLELWQLLFIPAEQQADYATAIATLVEQLRRFLPQALPLLPPHVLAYTQPLVLPPGPNYARLVAQLIDHLRAVPGLKLATKQFPTAASLATFEQVRWATGRPVPQQLLAFYGRFNGWWLDWQWVDQDPLKELRGGSLNIWSLETVFGGRHYLDRIRWDSALHDGDLWAVGHAAHVPGLAALRPFEQPSAEAYPCLQLPFSPDPAAPVALRWLAGDLDESHALSLDFTQYVARLFACAGVRKWQLCYRPDELPGEDPDFIRQVDEDLRRIGLDPAAVLPGRLH